MQVLREALRVSAVGVCLGLGAGLLMGFPTAPQAPQETVCLGPDSPAPGPAHGPLWMSQTDALSRLGDPRVAFVDARPRDDFQAGHVSGALSAPMDLGTIEPDLLEALRGARTVITYCDTADGCSRSTRLAGLLVAEGLRDVWVLEGGMPAWLASGHPAEAGSCRLCP